MADRTAVGDRASPLGRRSIHRSALVARVQLRPASDLLSLHSPRALRMDTHKNSKHTAAAPEIRRLTRDQKSVASWRRASRCSDRRGTPLSSSSHRASASTAMSERRE